MAEKESSSSGFYACYLLCSLNPRYKGRHYIGFTVNPRRRIRQHNGELGQGAWRTHKKRPWDMVLCVHGFSSQVEALQFEWAWQHPTRSLAVKEAYALIPSSVRGFKKQFFLLFTMLNCDKWSSMDLNVQFLSSKYIDYKKGCPGLPPHMGLCIAPVESLPCYVNGGELESDDNGDTDSEKAEGEGSDLDKDMSLQSNSRDLMKEDLMQDFVSSALDCRVQMNDIEVEKIVGSSGSVELPSDNSVHGSLGEGSCLLSGYWDMRTAVQFEGIKAKGRATPLTSSLHVDALPSPFESPIRENSASEAHTSPITGQLVSNVVHCGGNQGDGRLTASNDSILIDEPLSPFGFLVRSQSLQDAKNRTKVSQKPLPHSSQFGGVDAWMGISSLNWTRELSLSSSPLPFEEGTLASDVSPFTALMEQHSVQQPSSIAKRCLGQKQRSRLPLLSENPLPLRELSNVGNHRETFQRAPHTPPCAQRVVVVIPDTPIAMSREVIDLTDSPL